jgi:hypothetical protein
MGPVKPRRLLLAQGVALFLPLSLLAQSTASSPPATLAPSAPPVGGIENAWDVRTILANISAGNSELKSLLDKLNPQQWVNAKGASTGYILQWQDAERQVNDVLTVTKNLMQKTDSLSLALDDYFRMEAMDVTLHSLADGARQYADRGTSDHLNQLLAKNFNTRERLRDYIRDLTTSTEQNFKIADAEAQRCRGMISREPHPAGKKTTR